MARPRRSTNERGYGAAHKAARARWAPLVAAGRVDCWRCTHPIQPGQRWDLGHDDEDRTQYRGPEHRHCNRGSAAARGNRTRRRHPVTPPPRHSRDWLGTTDPTQG